MQLVLTMILAGILSNNYALLKFLGTGAVIDKAYSAKKSLLLGLATTVVMIVSTLIIWPVNKFLLTDVPYLQVMISVVVVLAVVQILYAIFKKQIKRCPEDFAKIAVSSAVLAICVQTAGETLGTAIATAAATGIGYMLTVTLYGKLRSGLDEDEVPAAFRGLPISLLTAGMIVLAVLALQFKF